MTKVRVKNKRNILVTVFITLLVFVSSLILLTSCANGDGAKGLEGFKQLLSDKPTDTGSDLPFAEKVYIIIPERCDAALAGKARELADAISDKTDVECVVKYDNEIIAIYNNDLLILLGSTSSLISQEAMKPLRKEDYICRWDRGAIVLGGRHDEATVKAIDVFMNMVLHGASNASLMSGEMHFENILNYDISEITVNGYDLYDFTFVYDSSDESFFEMVNVLRDHIALRSGYYINVIAEEKADETVGKVISFLSSESGEGAAISPALNSILVSGEGEYQLSAAISRFAELLFGNVSDGKAKLNISDREEIYCSSSPLNICTAITYNGGKKNLYHVTDLAVKLQSAECDVMIFGETDDETVEYISLNLPEGYRADLIVTSDGGKVPLIYRNDMLSIEKYQWIGTLLAVDIKAQNGEAHRIIKSFGTYEAQGFADAMADDAFCTVILDNDDVNEIDGMTRVGEYLWSFGGEAYAQTVFADCRYRVSEERLHVEKTHEADYFNVFASVEVEIARSREYYLLEDALK